MIVLTKGGSSDMVVTLYEKCASATSNFLFLFRNGAGEEVRVVFQRSADTSTHPARYNRFPVDVDTLFNGLQEGVWHYKVYEQESTSNTDETGLMRLETGYMRLHPQASATTTTYNATTTPYTVYNAG